MESELSLLQVGGDPGRRDPRGARPALDRYNWCRDDVRQEEQASASARSWTAGAVAVRRRLAHRRIPCRLGTAHRGDGSDNHQGGDRGGIQRFDEGGPTGRKHGMASRDGEGVSALLQMAKVVYEVGAVRGQHLTPSVCKALKRAGPVALVNGRTVGLGSRGAHHGGWGRSSCTPCEMRRRRTEPPP